MLPLAEINADVITLRNIRNFDYSSETDYTPRWYDKTVDMRQLDTLDLIAVYWMGDAIAHTILSFGFAGEQIAISIETRKEQGETYSTLAGLFRQYELYYVVGDERDLIGLRTNHRSPPRTSISTALTFQERTSADCFSNMWRRSTNCTSDPSFTTPPQRTARPTS